MRDIESLVEAYLTAACDLVARFCYHKAMTIGITGPRRREPWRGAVSALIIAGIVFAIGLILLGLTGAFLVDWLWFSAIGYLDVFWTTIRAAAEVFFAIFVATAIILWVNGSLASRFARPPRLQRPPAFLWERPRGALLPALFPLLPPPLPLPPTS